MSFMIDVKRKTLHPDPLDTKVWQIDEPSKWVNESLTNHVEWQIEDSGEINEIYAQEKAVCDYWVDLPGRFPSARFPETCGRFKNLRVCDKDSDHHKASFYHCSLYDCPVCWNTWKSKAAYRAAEKIFQWGISHDQHTMYHWTVSPPKDFDLDEIKNVEKSIKRMMKTDENGYTLVFHAYRAHCLLCGLDDEKCECWKTTPEYDQQLMMKFYFSPHWHIISNLDFIPFLQDDYEQNGFVMKRISKIPLNDLFRVFNYELGHCSKRARTHALKWWGRWSYNQMRSIEEVTITRDIQCKECEEIYNPMSDVIIEDYIDSDPQSEKLQVLYYVEKKSTTQREVKLYFNRYMQKKLDYWMRDFVRQTARMPNDFILDIAQAYRESKVLNRPLTQL